jgi:hypothetical protein
VILDYFKLYKTSWFWSFFFFLWFIFTYINNHLFYESIDHKSRIEIENLAKLVNIYSSSCVKSNLNTVKTCLKDIDTLLDEIPTYYGSHVTIKDRAEDVLLKQGWVQYKGRELLKLSDLNDELTYIGSLDATIEIVKRSKPSIWKSALRSMFFSITDIKILGGNGFVLNKAWLRSRPSWSFFIILLLSLQWVRLVSVLNLSNIIVRKKDAIKKSKDNLIVIKETVKKQKQKIQELENISKNKDGDIEDWIRALEEEMEALSVSKVKVGDLSNKIDVQKTEIKKLSNDENKYSNKQLKNFSTNKLKSILLNNPTIKGKLSQTSTTHGRHHGKSFIKTLIKTLKKDENVFDYITDVRDVEHDSHNRKTIIVSQDEYGNYVLRIVSSDDIGFSAQLMLSTHRLHNAVSIAKYITTIKQFKDYNIKVS